MPQQALDTVGVADAIVERGIKTSSMNYYDRNDTLLMPTDFNGLIGKTRFPFYILLPQNQTEDILSKKLEELGIPVFRSYKVVDMQKNTNNSSLVDVSFENGQSITAAYVVGADGAQSAVRASVLRDISQVLTEIVRCANHVE
jgi:2-polyprenyl-6-methoxyphenol hydroxylase-like FAD-dependent oxidoreductase